MIAQSLIAVASVVALFALAWAIRRIADRFFLSAESQRKAVHVGVGIHAMTLPLLLTREGFLIFAVLAAVALLVLRIPGVASDGIGASLHSVQRRSWGDFLFLVAVSLLFILTPGNPALYTLPIAILTLSDAAAALIGTEYGKLRFGGDDRVKSVEGSVTFFVVSWITCVIILLLETEIPRENVLLLATLVGAFATYVEAASWRGLDNLFVPVGIYVLLFTWANSPPLILAVVTAGWLMLLLAAEVAAPRFGMTPHAARSAAVALFLTVIIVQPINAVMPVLAFFAAFLAKPSGDDKDMVLDFVATLVLTGVAWLIIGNVFAINAIAFYSASFAAIGAGYAGYALRESSYRIVGGIASAGIVCLVYWLLLPGMIRFMDWVPVAPLIGFVVFVTLVTVLSEVLRPEHWSERNPGRRLAVTALVLLVPVYLYEVLQ